MGDIIIPEAVLDEFLQSLRARVTRDQEELAAEMLADVEAFRARLAAHEAVYRAQLQAGLERKMRVEEEKIVRRARAVEHKLRAFEGEIERRTSLIASKS